MDIDHVSVSGSLTRDYAAENLLGADTMQGGDAELVVNAIRVVSIDAVAATATRMRLARHLRLHPDGRLTVWPPSRSEVANRFLDLLSPYPEGLSVSDASTARPTPTPFTLVPATQILDSDAAVLVGEYALDACRRARISRTRASFVAQAATELADNAVIHAGDAEDPPVIAVTGFGRERVVEVAVTDAGTAISEAKDALDRVAAIPGRAIAGEPGFLGQIVRRGREAGLDVTVQIIAGTARLTWTPVRHRPSRARHVPGMTVIARIGA